MRRRSHKSGHQVELDNRQPNRAKGTRNLGRRQRDPLLRRGRRTSEGVSGIRSSAGVVESHPDTSHQPGRHATAAGARRRQMGPAPLENPAGDTGGVGLQNRNHHDAVEGSQPEEMKQSRHMENRCQGPFTCLLPAHHLPLALIDGSTHASLETACRLQVDHGSLPSDV
ncbi:uncharacterized protein LOC120892442 [Ictidomys tridecemlineatus]